MIHEISCRQTLTQSWLRWSLLPLVSLLLSPLPGLCKVPPRIAGTENTPLWVSAEEVAPGGLVHWELLPELSQQQVRDKLKIAKKERKALHSTKKEDPCSFYTVAAHSSRPPTRALLSPQDLASTAEVMLVGKVTDFAQGFYRGGEATVVEVDVAEYLTLPAGIEGPDRLYFVYFWAAFPLGDEFLCFRSERGNIHPSLGSSVLLAFEKSPDLTTGQLLRPGDHELFFSLPDGGVSAANQYPAQDLSFAQLAASMKEGRLPR